MFTAITSTQWQSRTTVAPNHVDSEPLAHCRDNGSAHALSSVVSTTIGFTTWTVKCHVIHVIYNRPCSNEFQEGKLCPAQLFPCVGLLRKRFLSILAHFLRITIRAQKVTAQTSGFVLVIKVACFILHVSSYNHQLGLNHLKALFFSVFCENGLMAVTASKNQRFGQNQLSL